MDEVTPDRDSYDYSQIDFSDQTDVDVFAAINPAGANCSKNYEIKDFQHKDVHVERLDIHKIQKFIADCFVLGSSKSILHPET